MKTLTLFGVLFCLTPLLVKDSIVQAQNWKLAGVVGLSQSAFEYEELRDGWDPEAVRFFRAGALVERNLAGIEGPLGKKMHIQTGLFFKRLAGRVNWVSEVGNPIQRYAGSFSINQFYATVPLGFKLDLFTSRFSLVAGLEAGLLISASKQSQTDEPVSLSTESTSQVGDEIRRLHTSMYVGAQVQLAPKWGVRLLYHLGLAHQKKAPENPVLITDWRTSEIDLSIIWYFP